jgi:hypothetical protein
MRFLSRFAIAPFLLAAMPAPAALPDPATNCTTVRSAEGRTLEFRGAMCLTPETPLTHEVTLRRAIDPARALKQGLIW